jgi:hypothetical protein
MLSLLSYDLWELISKRGMLLDISEVAELVE